jgi:hypothetical protein
MGNVTAITAQPPGAPSASNVATGIAYAPFGRETALTFGNGITGAYAFDANYRPTTRTDASGSTNILKHTYAYYNNDSLHTLTDAVAAANSQTLGFDALDRMTSATSGTGGYGSYAWTWDKVSNVVTQTVSGTKTTFNLVSGSNQLASTVTGSTTTTVDTTANGNIQDTKIGSTIVTSNTYNAANQMASALGNLGSSATYKYGFDGQRIEKAPPGTNPILYQYSRAANELHAHQSAGSAGESHRQRQERGVERAVQPLRRHLDGEVERHPDDPKPSSPRPADGPRDRQLPQWLPRLRRYSHPLHSI